MDKKGKVILKTQSQIEQLVFDETESRRCAYIFNVENGIIKVVLRCIIKKDSVEVK